MNEPEIGDRVLLDDGRGTEAVLIAINETDDGDIYVVGWPETMEIVPEECVFVEDVA